MGKKPGVILYFDMRKPISRLDQSQKGDLLDAILNFAEYGVEPELDPFTGMCFDFIRTKIEFDAQKYESTTEKRRYATYVREAKKREEEVLSFEEWKEAQSPDEDSEDSFDF